MSLRQINSLFLILRNQLSRALKKKICKIWRYWLDDTLRVTIWYTLMARTLQSITAVSITALLLYNDASWRELTFLVHRGEAEGGAILQHSKDLDYGVPLGPLAISSLAFFKTSKFQTRLWFSCENLAFLF